AFGVSTFGGGITNSAGGTITGGFAGLDIGLVGTFGGGAGGITNAGTIGGGYGVLVGPVDTFAAGISNTGLITANNNVAVAISSVGVFGTAVAGGGITNSGTSPG
ncbi:MAG: hypothetical protein WA652_20540, partial [Xanthobacteraceae bacterium]